MTNITDVLIIGGGAAGCAAAYFLSKNKVNVTLVEREGIASQASGYNAGGLNPMQGVGIPGPISALAKESFKMHKAFSSELQEESGVEFHPAPVDMIDVAFHESDISDMSITKDIFDAVEGFSAQWLESSELLKLEPNINPQAIKGLISKGNACLSGFEFTTALFKASEHMGASLLIGEATEVILNGDKTIGVIINGEPVYCGALIIATGPWSVEAESWLNISIPIRPVKGEIVRIKPQTPLAHDFSGTGATLYHRANGLVWVGATETEEGFNKEPTTSAKDKLLGSAFKLMPSLKDAEIVKHTACLRPITVDGLPIIGNAPGWENVYLATGAGRKGILLGPGIGKAIADLITLGKTDMSVDQFRPDRFS